jgi:hypothetical protein
MRFYRLSYNGLRSSIYPLFQVDFRSFLECETSSRLATLVSHSGIQHQSTCHHKCYQRVRKLFHSSLAILTAACAVSEALFNTSSQFGHSQATDGNSRCLLSSRYRQDGFSRADGPFEPAHHHPQEDSVPVSTITQSSFRTGTYEGKRRS